MSRNGSGVYNLPSGNPVVSGTTITTTWANTTLNDIAASLTGSVAADGQTPMTGALNMGSNKVTSVTDPTNAQDAATKNYTDAAITTATSGLGATYLAKANNLSDVASVSTSRTNLGLGTIATQSASSVAITGGSITGVSLNATDLSSGTVGYARLPTGSVLQVVQGKLSTSFSTTNTSPTDTGLTATITPKFSTSKILCFVTVNGIRNSGTVYNTYLYLNRNGTYLDATNGNSFNLYFTANQLFGRVGTVADMVLDSPANTSACTYKLQIAVENSSSTSYISDQASQLTPSTIILMEIAQ